MEIRWFGHACFSISNAKTIVTDPHDGRSIGIAQPNTRGDIVLISHSHFDHNCARIVKGEPLVIDGVGEKNVDGVEITGFASFHDNCGGEKRGGNIIFRIKCEDVCLCHLGDLGHVPARELLDAICPVDILFVPVGGVFTVDARGAWQVCKKIAPKVIIPMHYRVGGLSISINRVEPFLELAKELELVRVGNAIEFEKEDIPEDTAVWLFTL
jgi:L-ascorbate metabolism protein UlaG (beta-lactamase superfamily)